jgi:isopentenyl-diphosphate delta-isomerase
VGDDADLPARKRGHLQTCLREDVGFQRRTTGFEHYELPYTALPETDLAAIDTSTEFLGKPLAAPVLIGAMTGGAELAGVVNRNLATAAEELGIGMMLGSQRVMLEDPAAAQSFRVRAHAPEILLIGNLGAAQLNNGYGAVELATAVAEVGADALALHTNPLQEACQPGGDTDFRGLAARIRELAAGSGFPLILKEVGHGLSGAVARSVAGSGLAGLDVAGAGGTSWARVEQLVAHGRIVSPELAEWGIPTARALGEVAAAVPGMPLVASGGVRTGLDAAKAISLGASVVAVAHPLLGPAIDSAERVLEWLSRFIDELRVTMHCAGAADLDALAKIELGQA